MYKNIWLPGWTSVSNANFTYATILSAGNKSIYNFYCHLEEEDMLE